MLDNEEKINKEMSEHLIRLQKLFQEHGIIFKSIVLCGVLGISGLCTTYDIEEIADALKD